MSYAPDLEQARKDDPSGYFCGECREVNDLADDCGFFYVGGKALCGVCYGDSGHQTAER